MFGSRENRAVDAAILTKPVMSRTRLICVAAVYITSQGNLFVRLHWKKVNQYGYAMRSLNSKQKIFCCINVDRTAIWSLKMEIFAHFLRIRVNMRLLRCCFTSTETVRTIRDGLHASSLGISLNSHALAWTWSKTNKHWERKKKEKEKRKKGERENNCILSLCCCDTEIRPATDEMLWTRKAQWVLTSRKVQRCWHF